MYKIYLPITKDKKSSIHGLWSDKGRTYFDKIRIVNTFIMNEAVRDELCRKYNQLALFYTDIDGVGFCYDNRAKTLTKYTERLTVRHSQKASLKDVIKKTLKAYGGLTIYKEVNDYIIEVYHNKK